MQKNKNTRILGIDPGFGRVGFGIIDCVGDRYTLVEYGCIETDTKRTFVERLVDISDELIKIIRTHKPNCAAVEELFFYKNVTTAIKVGQARGVILLTLTKAHLAVHEYTPLEVKQSITGYGRADKTQLESMVKVILGIKKKITPDDAADALAIALTCAASRKMEYVRNNSSLTI
ncbi:MAG: crossover junction endodeoxyribonuclease RuvC [Candidatus Magasanikbacteria bacterium]|nr:crossover junction endodeoxyribonuclease RuvC [Candidatus Magasanikbacteria bacterium]